MFGSLSETDRRGALGLIVACSTFAELAINSTPSQSGVQGKPANPLPLWRCGASACPSDMERANAVDWYSRGGTPALSPD